MEWLQVEGYANGKLRYFVEESLNMSRSNDGAVVRPFAQQEMVQRFIAGVEPSYDEYLDRMLDQTLREFVESVAQGIGHRDPALVGSIKDALDSTNLVSGSLQGFRTACQRFKSQEFGRPILSMVQFLPKDELGNMAESLVSLTALKRKVSPEHPSVGGPIDVAIISKGDGFIWYRRKHYFSPEFNPHFKANYFTEISQATTNDKQQ